MENIDFLFGIPNSWLANVGFVDENQTPFIIQKQLFCLSGAS